MPMHRHVQLCNAMDCSPPGYSVYGISPAIVLEWVAMPFSRGSSQPRGGARVPCAGGFFTSEPPGKPTSGQDTFPEVLKSPLGAQAILLSTQKSQSLLLFSTFEVTMYLWEVGVQRFPWKVLISKK